MSSVNSQTTLTKQRPKITISPAHPSDAPVLAELSLLAFKDTPNLIATKPYQAGLSEEELLRIHGPLDTRKIRRKIVSSNRICLKATVQTVNPASGKPQQTIVGLANYENPSKTRLHRRTLWEWILAYIIYPIQTHVFRVELPSGMDDEIDELIEAEYEKTFGKGGLAEGLKPWYLHLLCVHPKWQGIGAGKALLDWGIEKAREEDAPLYLESNPEAYALYKAKGGQETGRARWVSPNGDPFVFTGMIWLPRKKA